MWNKMQISNNNIKSRLNIKILHDKHNLKLFLMNNTNAKFKKLCFNHVTNLTWKHKEKSSKILYDFFSFENYKVLPYQVFLAEVCPEMLILQVGVRYTLKQR
jgi:hypothetical protein